VLIYDEADEKWKSGNLYLQTSLSELTDTTNTSNSYSGKMLMFYGSQGGGVWMPHYWTLSANYIYSGSPIIVPSMEDSMNPLWRVFLPIDTNNGSYSCSPYGSNIQPLNSGASSTAFLTSVKSSSNNQRAMRSGVLSILLFIDLTEDESIYDITLNVHTQNTPSPVTFSNEVPVFELRDYSYSGSPLKQKLYPISVSVPFIGGDPNEIIYFSLSNYSSSQTIEISGYRTSIMWYSDDTVYNPGTP